MRIHLKNLKVIKLNHPSHAIENPNIKEDPKSWQILKHLLGHIARLEKNASAVREGHDTLHNEVQ